MLIFDLPVPHSAHTASTRRHRRTPPPTELAEVTKSITIALPTDRTEEYNLSVEFDEEIVVNVHLTPDTATYEFSLTGRGTGEYSIYIDGELLRTETVNFNA